MKPSTSLGTRSNVGMAKPSPPVRQAGNIGRLLVIHGVCRRSVPSRCPQVKYRCRCRVTAIHNFFLTGPDGTTAAERFFGQKPRSMFAAILESVELAPAPLSPPRKA